MFLPRALTDSDLNAAELWHATTEFLARRPGSPHWSGSAVAALAVLDEHAPGDAVGGVRVAVGDRQRGLEGHVADRLVGVLDDLAVGHAASRRRSPTCTAGRRRRRSRA